VARQGARDAVSRFPRCGAVVSGHEDVCLALGAYLVGSLVAAEREEFDVHLAGCPTCQGELAELAPVVVLLECVDVADWGNRAQVTGGSPCSGWPRRRAPGRRSAGVGGCGGGRRAWWPRWRSG
jgi:hypothetical protein